ncbi:hypothetical protein BDP55DRAFT_693485 [Colletotrichum godetiae]|uniref:Uncharacterized protein n=1 Tax=Colletotrichum godetiae TaxID=1209918 RepID=A0AAJ0ALT6_9PEZI|nr:uncharacterized protein BDP55DRAFT_693485 [Colletotrichum godetiae]KAK1676264.1 hypothetical protein BDP55DRAFT_693485 [Colletotrichum godetiae]
MSGLERLDKFHPPAFLNDFEGEQLEKWSKTVDGWFGDEIAGRLTGRKILTQFFNPLHFAYDSSLPPVPITWVRIKQPTDDARWAFAEDPENQRAPPGRLEPEILKFHRKNEQTGEDEVVAMSQQRQDRWVMDEYLEWSTKRVDGDVKIVSFTCEGPEYWEELAKYNPILTETPIENPATQEHERNNKILDIYKKLNPDFANEIKGDHLVDDKGKYNIYNRWNGHTNTGTIAHLIQINNSLSAEIDIAAQATVTRTDLVYGEPITNMITLCGDGSAYGNPGRNSDPTIGAAVNEVCRLARDRVCPFPVTISVKDPVALYMYDADFSSFLLDRTGKRRGNIRNMVPVPEGVFDWCDRGDIAKNMGLHLRVSIPKGLKTDDNSRDLNLSDLFDQNNGGRYVHYGSQFADYIFMSVSGIVGPKPPQPQDALEAWPGKPQPALTYTEPYLQKPFVEPKVLGTPDVHKMGEVNAVVTTFDRKAIHLRVEAKEGPSDYMGMPEPGPPNGPDYQSITPKVTY